MKNGTFCNMCFKAGKPASDYNSHSVKVKGKVVCPYLLSIECRYCHEKGHTPSGCPVLKRKKRAANEALKKYDVSGLPPMPTVLRPLGDADVQAGPRSGGGAAAGDADVQAGPRSGGGAAAGDADVQAGPRSGGGAAARDADVQAGPRSGDGAAAGDADVQAGPRSGECNGRQRAAQVAGAFRLRLIRLPSPDVQAGGRRGDEEEDY